MAIKRRLPPTVLAEEAYVKAADVRFQNKAILEQSGYKDFTASHEALHVLTDAAHDVAPYLDFGTEFGDTHTIWTVPPDSESARRDNGSIGSTKRISLPQEDEIQSSPLSK